MRFHGPAWWLAFALTLAACGGDSADEPAPLEPTTAETQAPTTPEGNQSSGASPAVNSLTVDPGDGTIMIGTGPALYRFAPGKKEAEEVTGQLSAPQGAAAVSGNLVVRYAAPGELLASGHPDGASTLPETWG